MVTCLLAACDGDIDNGGGGSGASASQNGSTGSLPANGSAGAFMTGGNGNGNQTGAGGGDCNPALVGVVRDFRGYDQPMGHPDFEHFGGDGLQGIVEDTLGADHKPVYAHPGPTEFTTGPAEFDQWYRDVAGVNQAIPYTILGTIDGSGLFTYQNNAFFPIDGQGFGNEGENHNFGFTFELHMEFAYEGGEIFTFTGDDDLWVFVNDRLAIDLGGLHSSQTDTLDVDARAAALGLVVGQTYPLDLFHAERHTTESNFAIQSNLKFTNCVPIVY